MEFVYKLFKYSYRYYVQGTEEKSEEYALLRVPKNASFANNRSTLVNSVFRGLTSFTFYYDCVIQVKCISTDSVPVFLYIFFHVF